MAVETRKTQLVDAALDCIQKLISHSILTGAVHSINHKREAASKVAGGRRRPTEDLDDFEGSVSGVMPPQVSCPGQGSVSGVIQLQLSLRLLLGQGSVSSVMLPQLSPPPQALARVAGLKPRQQSASPRPSGHLVSHRSCMAFKAASGGSSCHRSPVNVDLVDTQHLIVMHAAAASCAALTLAHAVSRAVAAKNPSLMLALRATCPE